MNHEEARIQARCHKWFTNAYCLQHHNPRSLGFAVPNENQHRLIAQGVVGGVADYIALHRGRLIFVEFKAYSGSQSPAQKKFESHVVELGYEYALMHDRDGATGFEERMFDKFQKLIEN